MGGNLKFKRASIDAIKKRMENMGRSNKPYYIKRDKGIVMYKFKDAPSKDKELDNLNFIRFLPPVVDDDYAADIYVHSFVGPDEGSYICLAMTFGEACPLCELYKELRTEGEDTLAKNLEPKKRTIYQILDVSEKPQSAGVLILDAPPTFADEILRLSVDRATKKLIDIADPETGREVSFVRGIQIVKDEKTGKPKTYPDYKGFQLGAVIPVDNSLASEVRPFDDLLEVPDISVYEKIVSFYTGQTDGTTSGAEEDGHRRANHIQGGEVDTGVRTARKNFKF
jgi:hypothetical protein